MRLGRLLRVAALDLRHNAGRPLFWILVLILALTSWGLSTGHMRIASGEGVVGGTKAWITSAFAMSQMLSFVVLLFYAFFISVAAGMTVIHDDDLKVGAVLHATPLTPSEYVLGKFAAVLASFVVVLGLHLGFAMFFNHVVPNPVADEIRGPFSIANYLVAGLWFALPPIVFFAGTAFAVGAWSRRPILVFVLPVAVLLVCGFFLWNWSPTWLDPTVNRLLMALDPAGFRWLNETWLKVDRGVEFYNRSPVGLDAIFVLNRVALLAVGLGSVWLANARFASQLRGERLPRRLARTGVETALAAGADRAAPPAAEDRGSPALASIGMRSRAPGFLRGAWTVARAELEELRSQPGLYLFVPLILIQTVGEAFFNQGAFDTTLLHTSGTLAVSTMNMISTLVCLLLLFYTVESMERERRSGFAAIFHATPVSTGAALLGKAVANAFIAGAILVAAFAGCMVALAIQGGVPLDPWPFLLVWGLMLVPTFAAWTAFVMAAQALARNRYTTYAVALGVLILTGYRQMTGGMNWAGNWGMWSALRWSDMSVFEIDRPAILLNRVMALGLAVLFVAFTARVFTRADRDVSRLGDRLRPASLGRGALGLVPWALVPLAACVALVAQIQGGFQGGPAKKQEKDYWRRNVATWTGAKYPAVVDVDLDLDLDPPRRWLHSRGTYTLVNTHDTALGQVPLTRGRHWRRMAWTLDGDSAKPEDRVGLMVFTPARPLAPGDTLRIGWDFEGRYPEGITSNGGGAGTFVLPAAVVLTSFEPSFAPVVGYIEDAGIDDKNRYDAREYPADFHTGITEPAFGSGHGLTTRIVIRGPSAYTYNSVGARISDTVEAGRRVTEWRSDHPVNFFNVVAGRWAERRGQGTVIYHHPSHTHNLDEMSEALDAARRWYSEWFMPYPWRELKLSEFPALAGYAQGFPTNITFSEALGFLTKSEPRANAAFMVTAHEAAHQWWGNLLLPGKGPSGNILSEGLAHFSTILLFDQVKGAEQRIGFCKRIEAVYGDNRQKDAERPLVRVDGNQPGDQTVTYDKGGWVFWMLMNHMGRERALAGMQAFLRRYERGPDHAVLQDFVATMREFAPDPAAYDAFAAQWFFDVVVPEYRIRDAKLAGRAAASGGEAAGAALAASSAPASRAAPPATGWTVSFEVENVGTGTMPVEVAAVRGERFPGEDAKPDPDKAYREARRTVVLGPGARRRVTLECPFEPERLVVDPDAKVLQLNRDQALAAL